LKQCWAYYMEFIRSNIYEIKKAGSLRTLGGILALFHLLLFYIWWDAGNLPLKYVQQDLPMCWSLFETCGWVRSLPLGLLRFLFYAYGTLMFLSAAVFLITDLVGLGVYLMVFSSAFGVLLYFQDLRLSSNEGYFILLSTFAYLCVPSKHRLMRWLIVSFFVAHGLSQASPDWLTGNWYIGHLNLPVKLAEWLAALSVLVQMIGAGALIFRDARYFWSGWISLFLFECAHLYMGELMSSAISMGALLYVAIDEFELRKAEREYIYQSFIRPEPSMFWGGILLGFFWLAQLSPFVDLGRNSRIKSFLDVWALHPEAAHEDCEQRTLAIYKDRIEEVDVEPQLKDQPALYCNVYMRYLDLRNLCKHLSEKDPGFVTLSSALHVRSYREKAQYTAFEVKDFCHPELTFKSLSEVRWTMNQGK
jgi:hypothetical protein